MGILRDILLPQNHDPRSGNRHSVGRRLVIVIQGDRRSLFCRETFELKTRPSWPHRCRSYPTLPGQYDPSIPASPCRLKASTY